MREIRIHGRGGDGAVTFAHMLSLAAILDGKFGQSCQGMTPLRRGAPIEGYARISEEEIVERGIVASPDYAIVLNPTIITGVNVELGMKENGLIFANSIHPLPFHHPAEYFDGTSLALKIVGSSFPNSVMLGAFAAWSGLVSLEALEKAAPEIMGHKINPKIVEKNLEAIRAAYHQFKERSK